jgi:hypothetical protein
MVKKKLFDMLHPPLFSTRSIKNRRFQIGRFSRAGRDAARNTFDRLRVQIQYRCGSSSSAPKA